MKDGWLPNKNCKIAFNNDDGSDACDEKDGWLQSPVNRLPPHHGTGRQNSDRPENQILETYGWWDSTNLGAAATLQTDCISFSLGVFNSLTFYIYCWHILSTAVYMKYIILVHTNCIVVFSIHCIVCWRKSYGAYTGNSSPAHNPPKPFPDNNLGLFQVLKTLKTPTRKQFWSFWSSQNIPRQTNGFWNSFVGKIVIRSM